MNRADRDNSRVLPSLTNEIDSAASVFDNYSPGLTANDKRVLSELVPGRLFSFSSENIVSRDSALKSISAAILSRKEKERRDILEMLTASGKLQQKEVQSGLNYLAFRWGFPSVMATFATLRNLKLLDASPDMDAPKRSVAMDQLYGPETAEEVFCRLQELNRLFNYLVQEVAYDRFWRRQGLSLKEKSLVTILTLMAMGLEEQLAIHLKGFNHVGGTLDQVHELVEHARSAISEMDVKQINAAIKQAKLQKTNLSLGARENEIVKVALCSFCLTKVPPKPVSSLSAADLVAIYAQQFVYLGRERTLIGAERLHGKMALIRRCKNDLAV